MIRWVGMALGLLLLTSCVSTSAGYQREIRSLTTSPQAPGSSEDAPPSRAPVKTGTLVVAAHVDVKDLELRLDDQSWNLGRTEVSTGPHRLTWRHFGSLDGARSVVISEDHATLVEIVLEPAALQITNLSLSRGGRINPDLAGPAGRVAFVAQANAPGWARLEVFAPNGQVVYSRNQEITTWTLAFRWDAHSTDSPHADGIYRVRLSAQDMRGREVAATTAQVTLDRTLPQFHPGTWALPAADIVEPGVVNLQAGASTHGGPVDGSLVWDNRLELELSAGLLPGWQLMGRGEGRLVTPVDVASLDPRVGLAVGVWRDQSSSASVRALVGPSGASVALVGGWYAEPWSFLALAQGGTDAQGLHGEVRGGLSWGLGEYRVTVTGLASETPFTLVSELAWAPGPEIPVTVGLLARLRVYSWYDAILYGGFGLSFALDTLDVASW